MWLTKMTIDRGLDADIQSLMVMEHLAVGDRAAVRGRRRGRRGVPREAGTGLDGELRFPSREECVLADLLERRAEAAPEKVFLVFSDREWTYAQTAEHAWRFANGLRREGVGEGDYVSVWMPTHPDLVEAWFGVNAAGGVYAPLNLAARGRYLEHTLNIAESRTLVAHAALLERLVGLDLPHLETVIVTGGEAGGRASVAHADHGPDTRRRGREPSVRPPARAVGRHEPDLHVGHDGPSKGVRAAYATFWNYHRVFLEPYVGAGDRFLQPLPMFHTAGTGITYSMLLAGGSVASARVQRPDVPRRHPPAQRDGHARPARA